jgi:hypothetical protein
MAGKLSKEQWASLRKKAEAGESDASLEAEFGILANAIRQKRFADKERGDPWKTPKMEELERRKKELEASFKKLGNAGSGKDALELATVSPAELARIKEEIPAHVGKKLGQLLLASLSTLPVPRSIGDFNTMFNAFRKAMGLDQQVGGGINIAISSGMNWSSQGQAEKPIVVIAQGPQRQDSAPT